MRPPRDMRSSARLVLVQSVAVVALVAGAGLTSPAGASTDPADRTIDALMPPLDTADVSLALPVVPVVEPVRPAIFAPPPPPGYVIPAPALAMPPLPVAPPLPVVAKVDDSATIAALKDIVDSKLATYVTRSRDVSTIEQFYAVRQNRPAWVSGTALTDAGKAVVRRIARADYDGLDVTDYDLPGVDLDPKSKPEALALADIRITAAVLAYARDASIGRTVPNRISSLITITPVAPEPAKALETVVSATDAGAALNDFNPPHDGYRALQRKLAELLDRDGVAAAPIPAGPVVKVGMRDPRVPALRARLAVAGDPADTVYDFALSQAVRMFQSRMSLPATGLIGPATVDALNGRAPNRQVNVVVSNMERWRWLPRELGERHIIVNIPEFMVRIVKGGVVVHQTRTVVGKPETPTPVFSDMMDHIVVNPSWTVPPSIVKKEMLPLWQTNPEALAARGIQVIGNGPVPTFRQPPGERNALGRIKFMFPNQHAVYLHDTPSRHLFSRDRRAFSHGCVRVQNPLSFGQYVFEAGLPGQDWSEKRIASMFGSSERFVRLTAHIPVHIVYMNAWVEADGDLVIREDLYALDARTQTALKAGMRDTETVTTPAPRREAGERRQRTSGLQAPAVAR